MKLFLGFDFYGAGNIGDDLVLAGFLTRVPADWQISCVTSHDPTSQRIRFPQVDWQLGGGPDVRAEAIAHADLWVGVGATPFSNVQKAWLLRHTERDLQFCRDYKVPAVMIGVDAEPSLLESHDYRGLGAKVLRELKAVVTRDARSVEILKKLEPTAQTELYAGIDLANLYLADVEWEDSTTNSHNHLGVCYWEETMERSQWGRLRAMLHQLRKEGTRHTFFANEVRPEFEATVYRQVMRPWDRLRSGRHSRFHCPNHAQSSLDELISHYEAYDCVLSSRYHALLIAAWSGAKPVAIGHRSKVMGLAHDLGLPSVPPPWSVGTLREALRQAKSCRETMLAYYERHHESCCAALSKAILRGYDADTLDVRATS